MIEKKQRLLPKEEMSGNKLIREKRLKAGITVGHMARKLKIPVEKYIEFETLPIVTNTVIYDEAKEIVDKLYKDNILTHITPLVALEDYLIELKDRIEQLEERICELEAMQDE